MRLEETLKKLEGLSIFLAYNVNTDVITHVDDDFRSLFSEDEIEKAKEQDPKLLNEKEDLLTGVLDCMERGMGNEIQIENPELKKWMTENVKCDEKRMGGQAGIMPNLLSKLGCRSIVYTTNLSKEQAALFEDNENLRFPVVEDGELKFKHPRKCWKDIPTKKNWIIEFFEGQELFGVKAGNNSRFIASSPYKQENLELGEIEGKTEKLAEEVDCMILAGYHNLLEEYPDGIDWREHLESAKDFIKNVKKVSPETNIQIEFAASHREKIRKAILKEVVPLADVFSFDLNELDLIEDDLDIRDEVPGPDSPVKLMEIMERVLNKLGVDAVSIHTHHYFLSVSRDYVDPEPIREGFKFARNAVWTKASGREVTPENLREALRVQPSERGEKYREELGEYLSDENFKEEGIHSANFDIVLVPNKIYEDPELSVGLGDVISATSFAVENALR
ncbi:MAG: ADP-dependent glucokinase/phosphofructokinase [Candidatus Aenigmatarchaeota archaeon]